MEAPLPMAVSSRDSAPSVRLPFPGSAPSAPYGAAHLHSVWSCRQELGGVESQRGLDCTMDITPPTSNAVASIPQAATVQEPSMVFPAATVTDTVISSTTVSPSVAPAATVPNAVPEMPRNSSVDSAISVASHQGYELTQIGLYTMHEKIGDGMYGSVRRAVHSVTKSEVAIKIIKKDGALRSYPGCLLRVYREIEVQKRLNHPYVLDLLQVMETETAIYLVTEYCKKGELFAIIQRRKRLPENEARKYFYQLLLAVQYLHARGVVHRDIKTENLLLDDFGNLKLADFGFSTFFDFSNKLETFCGSPQYAAPEVFKKVKYEGTLLDIWTLGVTLYVLLTGSTPFEGNNFMEIQERVLDGFVQYPYYFPPGASQILNMMLVKNADQRATIRQVLNHKWLRDTGIPNTVKTAVSVHNFVVEAFPREVADNCLAEMGISKQEIRKNADRLNNIDGMVRLMMKKFQKRRLEKVWEDQETFNAVIGEITKKAETKKRERKDVFFSNRIDGIPIQKELVKRDLKQKKLEEQNLPICCFLPDPEEYPYHEFKEEEEMEENERVAAVTTETNEETLRVADPVPLGTTRSVELANFDEAPQPSRVANNLYSVDSSEGYGGTRVTSAVSSTSPSLNSVAPPVLSRKTSDIGTRVEGAETRGGASAEGGAVTEQAAAPLRPKRTSLPECRSDSAPNEMKLANPPKEKAERKSFFAKLRLKRTRAIETGQSTSTFMPPPALLEGGSFDDGEEGKHD